MNLGDERLGKGQVIEALQAYCGVPSLSLRLTSCILAGCYASELDQLDQALQSSDKVFSATPIGRCSFKRLPAAGLLRRPPLMKKSSAAVGPA